jgi:tRNA threonylcarbamoyladenosine biosynthesis protein TsaB
MNFLSVDTSTKYSVFVLSNEEKILYGERRLFEKGRPDGLSEEISRCLKKTRMGLEQIDYFGVGIGPGSFTGLRIGLSIVKGLSYACKKPCLTFSSLDAIAFNDAAYRMKKLCVMVDARRSNVYCRFYTINPSRPLNAVKGVGRDRLLSWDSLRKEFRTGLAVSGDALRLYQPLLQAGGKRGAAKKVLFEFIPEKFWYPTPESIARLTQQTFRRRVSVDSFGLSAVYLYEQDCQVTSKC